MTRAAVLFLALGALLPAPARADADPALFAPFGPEGIERAARERRIVLLSVGTTWCHWCHVMHRTTYADPAVRAALAAAFLPLVADGDARPDLSERFRNYRWPATAFLTPDGRPILVFRGHRDPHEFLRILGEVRDLVRRGGPFPGFETPAPVGAATEPADDRRLNAIRDAVRAQLDLAWDATGAGWGRRQKYPIPEPVEHGLLLARLGRGGEGEARIRALRTLEAERALIDPVWGGMYQYGEEGAWNRPHFEKIVPVNAGALHNFADAFATTGVARWRADGEAILRWLRGFLRSPSGAFFTSQDAEGPGGMSGEEYFVLDDLRRRRLGLPRIDRRIGALENGLLIAALARFAVATGERRALDEATAAAEAVLATHRAPGGGFRHLAESPGPLYLADQVEMGRGFLALLAATAERRWLEEAEALGDLLRSRFADGDRGGFFDHTEDSSSSGLFATRLRSFEPNAAAARFLLALGAAAGRPEFREDARRTIAAIGDPASIERHGRFGAGLLLAVEEARLPWARIEVVGPRDDARAGALVAEALRLARTAPMVFAVRATSDGPAHAIVCGEGTCSDRILDAGALATVLARAREAP